jgi:hypothetical protein
MGDDEVFVVPLDEVCVYWEEFFRFNYKIMINVQESPPSIMVVARVRRHGKNFHSQNYYII